jgi:hypothetical protein
MDAVKANSTAFFEDSQSEPCGSLLGLFLAAALGSGKPAAFVPDLDLEGLLMLRSGGVVKAVLSNAEAAFLKPFLQGRLVVGPFEALAFTLERRIEQRAAQEGRRGREAGVEVNGANNRFVGVGEEPLLFTPAGFLLARPEAQERTDPQPARRSMNRRGAHKPGQSLRELACVPLRKEIDEPLARDETEDTVA